MGKKGETKVRRAKKERGRRVKKREDHMNDSEEFIAVDKGVGRFNNGREGQRREVDPKEGGHGAEAMLKNGCFERCFLFEPAPCS